MPPVTYEVPAPLPIAPLPVAPLPVAETHSTSVSQVIPAIPHNEYGPPAADYGVPHF